MDATQALEAHLRRHHVGEPIIERVLRLNPNRELGTRLRGIHRKPTLRHDYDYNNFVGKGEFIRRFGRSAWEFLEQYGFYTKQGRRVLIARETVEDRVWLRPVRVSKGLARRAVIIY